MSKKKDRAWFVCPQWPDLIDRHYPDDATAARALHADPKVLARLRQQTPVAKSTLLRMMQRLAGLHRLGVSVDALIVDTRSN